MPSLRFPIRDGVSPRSIIRTSPFRGQATAAGQAWSNMPRNSTPPFSRLRPVRRRGWIPNSAGFWRRHGAHSKTQDIASRTCGKKRSECTWDAPARITEKYSVVGDIAPICIPTAVLQSASSQTESPILSISEARAWWWIPLALRLWSRSISRPAPSETDNAKQPSWGARMHFSCPTRLSGLPKRRCSRGTAVAKRLTRARMDMFGPKVPSRSSSSRWTAQSPNATGSMHVYCPRRPIRTARRQALRYQANLNSEQ